MSTLPVRPVLTLTLLACAGCTTTSSAPAIPSAAAPSAAVPSPTIPSTAQLSVPRPAVELSPASITGSEESSTMLDNFTVFLTAVDGVPVAAGRQGWDTRLSLKPGPHRLTLGFNRGVFSAKADLELIAVSGASYQVRFATDAELFGNNSYCDFWIVDTATDQPVSARVRSGLTKIEPPK